MPNIKSIANAKRPTTPKIQLNELLSTTKNITENKISVATSFQILKK